MPAELRLLRRLVDPDKHDLLEAEAVVEEINDLIVGIGRDMATRDGGFILTFAQSSGLSEAVHEASYREIEHAQYRAQLDWVRSDLMNGATLLIPRDFKAATDHMRLVSNTMVYTLGPLRERGTPVWDIAVCTHVTPRQDRLPLRDAIEHELPQAIEIARGTREAQEFRARMGTAVLDWSGFSVAAESAPALNPTDLVRQALVLVQVVELFMKRLEIYPVEIGSIPGSPLGTVHLRARTGGERDRIALQIGMPDTAAALRFTFDQERSNAHDPWIISASATVGQRLPGDVSARFVRRIHSDQGYFYRFEVDDVLPRGGPLYLKAAQESGTDSALRRRLKNIRALDTRLDLVGMLADPYGAATRARKLFEPFRYIAEEDERRGGQRRISATLTEQRRMDPAIAQIVSTAFYRGQLTTESLRAEVEQHGARRFRQLAPLPGSPVVIIDFPHVSKTGQARGLEQDRPRWHNPSEVEAVLNVLRCVRAKQGQRPKLAILSPYGAQVDLLDQRLSAVVEGPLSHLKYFNPARPGGLVGTVDSFQGSEADLVVLSLVRNNPRVGGAALGFLRDRRRINVALSRAMSRLVIVGSLSFLREGVRGVNPDEEEHDLSFFTEILNTIEALTEQKRKDGIPLATVMPSAELTRP